MNPFILACGIVGLIGLIAIFMFAIISILVTKSKAIEFFVYVEDKWEMSLALKMLLCSICGIIYILYTLSV